MLRRLASLLLVAAVAAPALAQGNPGPDVIVGSLNGMANYGALGGIDAFAVGTTSCNVGTANLSWVANTPAHPVIAQHMYRLHEGRFEMIGQSWLKHGFTALTQNLCDQCNGQGGTVLGVGCSDPYDATLNGSQSGLGPKWQVNAATGVFPYPYAPGNGNGNSIYKRLQVATSDLGLAGARYFVEGHYVTADDAAAGNDMNNAAWREIALSGGPNDFSASFQGGTVPQQPALFAWQAIDPDVQLQAIDVPGDGRIWVGFKSRAVGGGQFAYEYAVYNYNSDRSVGSVSIAMPGGATVSGIGFHDVAYHSGEPFGGNDWIGSYTGAAVQWSTTPHAVDPNANAVRWGTLYNFRFVANAAPGTVTLGLFKPGTPVSVSTAFSLPPFALEIPQGAPAKAQAYSPTLVTVSAVPLGGAVDPAGASLMVSLDGGPFSPWPLAPGAGNVLQGYLPPFPCGSSIDWYVTAGPLGGGAAITLPADAPATTFHTDEIGVALVEDHAETDIGWSVSSSGGLTGGAWNRGVPVGLGDRGDPPADADGSGQCWLTENAYGNSDVDGGSTTLSSPVFDLAHQSSALLSYDFWFVNDWNGTSQSFDTFVAQVSADGNVWTTLDTTSTSVYAWQSRTFDLADFVTLSAQVQVRFVVADAGAGSVVEAGLDDLRLEVCRFLDPATAAGNVGITAGGPYDVLRINGSAGGPQRRVVVAVNAPLTFAMTQSPVSAAPAAFALLGHLGHVNAATSLFVPGFGTFAFTPCPAAPSNPALFMLANNLAPTVCPPLLPAWPTPWSFLLPAGLPFPAELALQALVVDPTSPSGYAISNAVLIEVRN